MTTVTATTQAELDAALADSATEYIEVHSPATDELTIDTDRTDVAISIRGESVIRDVGGSATIRGVWGSATIRGVSGGCAIVGVYDTATLRQIGPHVSVHLYSTQATVDGDHVIDLTGLNLADPAVWCEHNGVRVDSDDLAHLYKAVDDEHQAGHNYLPTIYRVGADVAAPDWQDTHECGNGLHVSPRPVQARSYYPAATRFLEVATPVVDLRPIDATKAKARSVHVLREVDINGDPLEGQA